MSRLIWKCTGKERVLGKYIQVGVKIQYPLDLVATDYSGHTDIVATLGGTESFPIIFGLNKPLIVDKNFGYSGHLIYIIIVETL